MEQRLNIPLILAVVFLGMAYLETQSEMRSCVRREQQIEREWDLITNQPAMISERLHDLGNQLDTNEIITGWLVQENSKYTNQISQYIIHNLLKP